MGIILTDTDQQIETKINEAIAYHINMSLKKYTLHIEDRCKKLVSGWILSQPEIVSLQSGDSQSLAGLFGVPAGMIPGVVDSIINAVQESIQVMFKVFDEELRGELEIRFQPAGFENLLSLPYGHVFYESGDLHWLKWLLTEGSSIIIANYQYTAKPGTGRSGLGTMTIGSSFRIPPGFSGTLTDNFITRALTDESREDEIVGIFQEYLQ